jgi:hypothetical protein
MRQCCLVGFIDVQALKFTARLLRLRHPHFCVKDVFTFSACEAGDRIEPGVEPKAEPQEYVASAHQAREAGDSFCHSPFDHH